MTRPRSLTIALAGSALALVGPARAQEANPHAISAEAPIVAGNAASAKQRALDDAFRQAVERSFAVLMAEAGLPPTEPPPAGLMQLKSTFFSRAKRYVRSYHVLEQSEEGGRYRLQIDAEIDEGLLRREIDRARGAAPTAAAPAAGAPSVVVGGAPAEATQALVRALGSAGVKATTPAGPIDEGQARQLATRDHASAALVVSGNVTDDGAVRGTTKWATGCRLAVRVLPIGAAPPADRAAEARAFSDGAGPARAECLARVAGDVARQIAGSLGGGPVVGRDMRMVSLELDLIEPAALPLLLQACKKLGSVSSAEVRRVTVGHVELRAVTRLAAGALIAALARELTGTVDLVPGQTAPDRASVQVRLTPAPLPPPAGPPPAATP